MNPATPAFTTDTPPTTSARRVRSALFIDFDNIFYCIDEQDRKAASDFAQNPERWLRWLRALPLENAVVQRDILIRRCYLNPGPFSSARPFFIAAGFEVIDCPALTRRGKNSADILIVMDMLDALAHSTHFDEFIILSGDADFTPLLRRLRAHDRRSMVVAVGPTATAYTAVCDQLVSQDDFIEAVSPPVVLRPPDPAKPVNGPAVSPVSITSHEALLTAQDELCNAVRKLAEDSDRAIPLASLAMKLRERFYDVDQARWLGNKTLKNLLNSLSLEPLKISNGSPGFLYDPTRHVTPADLPIEESPMASAFQEQYSDLYELAMNVQRVTKIPLLLPEKFHLLFEEIAAEINTNGYALTVTSRNVRDRCTAQNCDINRNAAGYVLKGIGFGGHRLGDQSNGLEEPTVLAERFFESVIFSCRAAQMELSDDQISLLRRWLVAS